MAKCTPVPSPTPHPASKKEGFHAEIAEERRGAEECPLHRGALQSMERAGKLGLLTSQHFHDLVEFHRPTLRDSMPRNHSKLRLRSDWSESRFQSVLNKILRLSSINSDGAMSWSDFKIDIYFSIAYEAFEKIDVMSDRELRHIIRRAIINERKKGDLRSVDVITAAKKLIREYERRVSARYVTAIDIAIDLPIGVDSKSLIRN